MSFIINPYKLGTVALATFDPATDILTDSLAMDYSIVEFAYDSGGVLVSGPRVYSDSVLLDCEIVEFVYSAGNSPSGATTYLDDIDLDVSIVDFSYTT
jgi:hypothetical protein